MTTFISLGSNCRKSNVGFQIPDDPSLCWPWIGHRTPAGYGQVYDPAIRHSNAAHRVVWQWVHQKLLPRKASGMELHHTCFNRPCVNPSHLHLVTIGHNRSIKNLSALLKRRRPIPHGTTCGYQNRHCRCEPCRQAWSDYGREKRFQKKISDALFLEQRNREPVESIATAAPA